RLCFVAGAAGGNSPPLSGGRLPLESRAGASGVGSTGRTGETTRIVVGSTAVATGDTESAMARTFHDTPRERGMPVRGETAADRRLALIATAREPTAARRWPGRESPCLPAAGSAHASATPSRQ